MEKTPNYPFWKFQLPAILFAIGIFIGSSISDVPMPRLNLKFIDKWVHFIAYAILTFAICRAYLYQSKYSWLAKHVYIFAIITGSLYGASDEYHQSFVVGRTSDVLDFVADSVGAVLGTLAFYLSQKFLNKKDVSPKL